jgi:hypothetical protein
MADGTMKFLSLNGKTSQFLPILFRPAMQSAYWLLKHTLKKTLNVIPTSFIVF